MSLWDDNYTDSDIWEEVLPKSVNSLRKPIMDEITDAMIDAGAQALRERQQGGKVLNPWSVVTKRNKEKWWGYAHAVLIAAQQAWITAEYEAENAAEDKEIGTTTIPSSKSG